LILIDANIFMYAAGAEHPYKTPSVDLLRRVALGEINAAVDAEVLQEILHRYRAIRRWEDGREVYALARRIVPLVVAITDQIVDRARDLLDDDPRLGARDALHAAVVLSRGMDAICSYDRDLDKIIGMQRIEPPAQS
jgi:predicted nucleic acid-binding protein